jgi:metallophosphoesterase superfamily enzyme
MSKGVTMSKRFVALFDVHIGREYKDIRGQRKVQRTHNLKALRAVMDFVEDWKPDVFILGGDQLNCGPISHWHRGKPRVDEGFRLRWEYDVLEAEVLNRVRNVPEKVWMQGNHEMWIQHVLDAQPGLEGLVEPESYLEDLGEWDHYAQGEIYKLGKLYFIHGDTVRPGKNVASRAVAMYRRNLRMGHHHRFDAETDVTPIDQKNFYSCIVVPAMSTRGMAYRKNAPENHMQGFLLGEVYPNGDFQDHVMIINKNRFYWNGKKYGR